MAGGTAAFLNSCKKQIDNESLGLPPVLKGAPKGRKLRAGLVGTGARGTGAAINFISAGPDLEIVALADVFQDKIDACRERFASFQSSNTCRKLLCPDLTGTRN